MRNRNEVWMVAAWVREKKMVHDETGDPAMDCKGIAKWETPVKRLFQESIWGSWPRLDSDSGSGQKWMDLRYILEVELIVMLINLIKEIIEKKYSKIILSINV